MLIPLYLINLNFPQKNLREQFFLARLQPVIFVVREAKSLASWAVSTPSSPDHNEREKQRIEKKRHSASKARQYKALSSRVPKSV